LGGALIADLIVIAGQATFKGNVTLTAHRMRTKKAAEDLTGDAANL
jgi:hypothetical protein